MVNIRKCVVKKCAEKNDSDTGCKLTLFRAPRDAELRKIWSNSLKIKLTEKIMHVKNI